MIRGLIYFGLSLFVLGCASAEITTLTKTDLKYNKVLVLPFTDSDEGLKTESEKVFLEELKTFTDAAVISATDVGANIWTDLGIENPSKYSVIDFSVSSEGYERRKKIQDNWQAKAIILGSLLKKANTLSMYIQMIDAETGELTLSFSKVEDITTAEQEAVEKLAKASAQKVINHIKDNVVVTNIRRY